MDEVKLEDIPTTIDEKVEEIEDYPDNEDDQVKWFMKRDRLKNPDDVLKVLQSFKVGPLKMNDFIDLMKTLGSKSAIAVMYEYEKEYKETYGKSLSVIGSAVKRKLLNKKLIQIMDSIKYEKEMTGPRPKIRPENAATAMSKHIESTVFENKQKEAASKVGAVLKGNSARKKVAEMRENRDAKNAMIEDDVINIQSAIRGAIARKKIAKVKAQNVIQEAVLEKQAELSQMPTYAQPGNNKTIKYSEYNNELNLITPYDISHDAFKKNIKQTVLGPQSAKNLINYVEKNHREAVRYIKENSEYVPRYKDANTKAKLIAAIKDSVFIDTTISSVPKATKIDKSEGVQTRGMASSSKPNTRSRTKKA